MSEQSAESGSNEPNPAGTEPVASGAHDPAAAENKTVVTGAAANTPEHPTTEPKIEPVEAPSVVPEPSAVSEPRADTETSAEPKSVKSPGQIMVMSPARDETWSAGPGAGSSSEVPPGTSQVRRTAVLAAVIVLAAATGAIGSALTSMGIGHFAADAPKAQVNHATEDAIARIDTEIAALRTSFEHASKYSASQFGKANDRLDKIEKAQAEPAAKLAKLSDAVEKLRVQSPAATAAASSNATAKLTDAVEKLRTQAPSATASAPAIAATTSAIAAAPPPVVVASAAPKDTTGMIAPPATSQAAAMPGPKSDVARLPTVDGWVLRDVGGGGAVIESRRGMFEVYAGDNIPGLGRVDAVRRQDGRWVVVTSRGLIVGAR